jgi:hypothetical protein
MAELNVTASASFYADTSGAAHALLTVGGQRMAAHGRAWRRVARRATPRETPHTCHTPCPTGAMRSHPVCNPVWALRGALCSQGKNW